MIQKNIKRRILFVDDEPRVLSGLQRMLRSMRNEWDMKFAENGFKALEMLSQDSFDVVVSDMRMPGMDGAELLEQIRQLYPSIVRIVLSGHSDQEMILKSILPAHRFLSKPCDSMVIISTVKRSCALRDLLKQKSLKEIISNTSALPSLPSLYNQLVKELNSTDGSIQTIGKIIGKDLSMTAKILQLINSSFFGHSSHVSNPSEAVILLGIDTIKALVLTIGLFSKFDTSTLKTLKIKNIFDHSLKTGAIAREIAKTENMEKEIIDNSFMAGMLHDLGKLVLAVNFPKDYAEVLKLSDQGDISFHDAEKKILGATHAEVGAYLLGLWGLPETIVEAVAFHHTPRRSSMNRFCVLTSVYIANILEHSCETPTGIKDTKLQFDENYMVELDLHRKLPAWKIISKIITTEN